MPPWKPILPDIVPRPTGQVDDIQGPASTVPASSHSRGSRNVLFVVAIHRASNPACGSARSTQRCRRLLSQDKATPARPSTDQAENPVVVRGTGWVTGFSKR